MVLAHAEMVASSLLRAACIRKRTETAYLSTSMKIDTKGVVIKKKKRLHIYSFLFQWKDWLFQEKRKL